MLDHVSSAFQNDHAALSADPQPVNSDFRPANGAADGFG